MQATGIARPSSLQEDLEISKMVEHPLQLENAIAGIIDTFAAIDPQSVGEQELDTGIQDSCNQSDTGSEADVGEDSKMPPPLPYYERNPKGFEAAKPGLTRSASAENLRCEPRAKMALLSQRMHQSMPNLYSSRSYYNRRVGSTPDFRTDEKEKNRLQSRMDELEALLADL